MIESSFLGVLLLTQDMTEKGTCYFIHFESDWKGFADFLFRVGTFPPAYIDSRQQKTKQ